VDAAHSPAILTVFRSRLRREAASLGYHELADDMERRARAMPGFVEFTTFTGDDGERVSIVIFDSVAHHNAWRDDPQHISANQRGIEEFYTEYQITVTQVVRQHTHTGPDSGP
jgi:heme-degrading monooxygenase HmoA